MVRESRRWVQGLILVAVLILAAGWVHRGLGGHPSPNPGDWFTHLRGFGYMAWGAAAALVVAHAVFPYVPFVVLAGANVALFGALPGFLINWLGIAAGASLLFWLSRGILRGWVRRRWRDNPLAERLDRAAASKGWILVALTRLVPVIPSSAIDGLAGISGMMYRSFLVGTLLGTFPMIAVESFFGGAFWRPEGVVWSRALLGGVAWLVLVAGGLWMGRSVFTPGKTRDSRNGPRT
ncbi:VTT domain-containing protein [Kyrpidia sp.]|uniref:TVP38/TMEM64 family protein n=1 Tax=Kyrpidia sp. TaxID=2073077 RepID=UPI0025867948|nr:VTT domain-containing protein [Kyrpidia sp.]MCL6576244.1 VTT domain-containing protein [Kyrpidia sp.]